MKKFSILFLLLMLHASSMWGVPAHPKPVKVMQPDGSFVTIKLNGDEWLHFNTTEDGYSVVKDSRGYYVYAEMKGGQLKATTQVAHDAPQRAAAEQAFLKDVKKWQAPAIKAEKAAAKQRAQQAQRQALASRRATDYANFKGLIILVQFNDKEFSRADYKTIITDMVNQKDYTGFDDQVYTGSVRDYFSDNSDGKFQPQFDIIGPVTVDYSQYDGYDKPAEITCAALEAVDSEIDFKDYDGDNDGVVDLVYFLIAGNGSNYSGNDGRLWWPMRSNIVQKVGSYYYNVYMDGVKLWDYASSVEFYGWTNAPETLMIDGIGTICHEFSHVLGLPDFYDTDYAGSGGQSIHPANWTVMASGSYKNNSRTPVGYSLYERYSVGFTAEPTTITTEDNYTLLPLFSSQTGYRIDSPVANEFFLLENRQNDGSFKWDTYLPGSGMLIHHVDLTNSTVWVQNKVNADPSHNYYEIVRAGGTENHDTEYDVFPGTAGVTELSNTTTPANLKSHEGKNSVVVLNNIQMNDGVVTFDAIDTSLPKGDANGDHSVTITDAVAIVNHILGNPSENFKSRVADVNEDGNITITDAVGVVNIILNPSDSPGGITDIDGNGGIGYGGSGDGKDNSTPHAPEMDNSTIVEPF